MPTGIRLCNFDKIMKEQQQEEKIQRCKSVSSLSSRFKKVGKSKDFGDFEKKKNYEKL